MVLSSSSAGGADVGIAIVNKMFASITGTPVTSQGPPAGSDRLLTFSPTIC
jgi:hypothetical protein